MTDTILLIEDDSFWASLISKMLAPATVLVARNGAEGMEIFERKSFDLVITDLVMPEKDGLAVIVDLRKSGATLPIIAISGGGNVGARGDLVEALRAGRPGGRGAAMPAGAGPARLRLAGRLRSW